MRTKGRVVKVANVLSWSQTVAIVVYLSIENAVFHSKMFFSVSAQYWPKTGLYLGGAAAPDER